MLPSDNPSDGRRTPDAPSASTNSTAHTDAPAYRKPVFRRYDQIEQVKPYGPSEMEAG